ncbi:MAG: tRNA (adenosine(37)-N6)-dimethylallyltransferase MiaA, partial [Bacteroidetes bacterium]|nr:tRNA (adenosine(37)-N6)-dimethylallyltransferase MiaA [Bacteroidota bacterium]
MHPVLVITGPTASGKSAVAMSCAAILDAELISADSRQVYRGLDIGTAKPSVAEQAIIPHHGIDIADPGDTYTAGRFFEDARSWITDIHERGRRAIVVGGSGLYVRVLTQGIFEGPEADPELRAALQQRLEQEGKDVLLAELARRDPEAARTIDADNPVRLLRALEVCILTGEAWSVIRRERMRTLPWRFVQTAIAREREDLYSRINRRVDAMVDAGLFDEVRRLLDAGVDPSWPALNTVGYKEIIAYFRSLSSRDQCIELIKRNTRRFAKRQLTWFRNEDLRWIPVSAEESAEAIVRAVIDAAGGQG